MKNRSISKVMTPAPATVRASDSIAAAERVMREHRCHHVPVVDDDGRIVGIVGARDLLKGLVLESESESDFEGALKQGTLQRKRVAEVMRHNVIVLSQTATVLDAARALARGYVHALPVVAPGGVLAGIVTSSDLIETLADALEHPIVNSPAVAAGGEQASDEQLRLLQEVYRSTIRYLESGHGEIEHGRLLLAVGQARERITQADLSI